MLILCTVRSAVSYPLGVYDMKTRIEKSVWEKGSWQRFVITCVTLAKAGLVVGPLHPPFCPSIHSSVRPSVLNTFWVTSLCNL